MATYITTQEARDYIGVNAGNDVAILGDVVEAVSRLIEGHCGDIFTAGTAGVNRVFEPQSTTSLRFGLYSPLSAVTAVKVDTAGDGTYATTISSTDYTLYPLNPSAAPEPRPYRELTTDSSRLTNRVQITGTWGWANVPAAVKMACRLQVARVFNRKDSPTGVAGSNDFGVVRIPTKLDPDVALMLKHYRMPELAGFA